jgi:hypothetical protein
MITASFRIPREIGPLNLCSVRNFTLCGYVCLTEKDGGREATIRRLQNLRRLDPQSQVLPAHHSPLFA